MSVDPSAIKHAPQQQPVPQQAAQPSEEVLILREIRGYVQTISVIVVLFAIVSVIGGIILAVQVHSADNNLNNYLNNNGSNSSCIQGVDC